MHSDLYKYEWPRVNPSLMGLGADGRGVQAGGGAASSNSASSGSLLVFAGGCFIGAAAAAGGAYALVTHYARQAQERSVAAADVTADGWGGDTSHHPESHR